jgi:hypothetical protein
VHGGTKGKGSERWEDGNFHGVSSTDGVDVVMISKPRNSCSLHHATYFISHNLSRDSAHMSQEFPSRTFRTPYYIKQPPPSPNNAIP